MKLKSRLVETARQRSEPAMSVAGIILALASLLVLLGWLLGIEILTRLVPGPAAMHPATAAGFLCLGAGLIGAASGRLFLNLGRVMGLVTALLGIVALLAYSGVLDQHALQTALGYSAQDGSTQLSPATAMAFVLTGISLLSLGYPVLWTITGSVSSMLVLAEVMVVLSIYLLGLGPLYKHQIYAGMALHTALLFLLANAALLLTRWSERVNVILKWLPLGVGLAALTLTLALWHGIWVQERASLQRQTLPEQAAVTTQIAGLQGDAGSLPRLARAVLAGGLLLSCFMVLAFQLFVSARNQREAALRSRDALQKSEVKYHHLLQSMQDGVFVAREHRFLFVNPAMIDMLGYTQEEFASRRFEDVVAAEYLPVWAECCRQCLQGVQGPVQRHDVQLQRRDGEYLWVELSVQSTQFEDRPGVLGIVHDISERKVAQSALLASEARFRGAMEHAAIGMAVVSLDGHWLEVNRALCSIVDYTPEELAGLTYRNLTHPDDLASTQAHVDQVMAGTQASYTLEKRYLRRHGAAIWVRIAVSLVRDAYGRPEYFIAQIEDIDRRKRAEERLQATLALQAAILNSSGLGMIATGKDGIITLYNHAAERMLGYAAGDVVGKMTPEPFHDHEEMRAYAAQLRRELDMDVSDGFDVFIARALHSGQDVREWTYIRKDGSRFPVSLTVTLIEDEQGEIMGYLGMAADISRRKEEERKLNNALQEKEVLLKEVYHRVKNNLQVIRSLLNLQGRTLPQGEARVAMQETAERVRAMALVHEKLYQSGNLAAVYLPDYIAELVQQMDNSSNAAEHGVRIITEVDPVEAGLDTTIPLGLLLNELVSNSIKHAFPDGGKGEVRIVFQRRDEGARLTVSDSGVGLPADLDISRAASMGLKLATSLATQLGGKLLIHAGEGASFSVDIPVLR